jgi:radical SAM superfamily enzyme YgiQ (UPF0313 family)
MDILVIATNRNSVPSPVMPAGACIVAEAAERAGHAVRVLDLMFARDPMAALESELRSSRPDVVGLSIRNIDGNDMQNPVLYARELLPLIRAVRGTTDAEVILGGPAVAVMPEELMRYTGVHLAVPGHGDVVFPELLENLPNKETLKKTPGIAWIEDGVFKRNPLSCHLAPGFKAPDFKRWIDTKAYLSRLSTVPVQTKLGCNFRCVYCTYRNIEGHSYRCLEPGSVVEAVRGLVSQGLRDLEFVDNVFNSPYAHAMDICEELARARTGARFHSMELNPYSMDDTLVTAMERAGFASMAISAESASDDVLKGLQKGFSSEDVHRTAEVVSRHSLPCLWIFLLGGPGETEASVRETLRFAEHSIRPGDAAFFNVGVRIYPGTELETLAREQGLLSLSPGEMLEPVFYISPEVGFEWMLREVRASVDTHMNFMDLNPVGMGILPTLNRVSYRLGIGSPLWRYTRQIRRGLRLLGIAA